MISAPNLHDSTFTNLIFELEKAKATLTFKTGVAEADTLKVLAEGVKSLKVPRLLPWGPSNSVNTTTITAVDHDQFLSLEMQSGDVLEIVCGKVSIEKP